MVIAKPKGKTLTGAQILAQYKAAPKIEQFGICYIDEGKGNKIIEKRNIYSYNAFLSELEIVGERAALIYLNDKYDAKTTEEANRAQSECMPLVVNEKICFAIDGGCGYYVDTLNDNIFKRLSKLDCLLLNHTSVFWMVKQLFEKLSLGYKRNLISMDNEGNFKYVNPSSKTMIDGVSYFDHSKTYGVVQSAQSVYPGAWWGE